MPGAKDSRGDDVSGTVLVSVAAVSDDTITLKATSEGKQARAWPFPTTLPRRTLEQSIKTFGRVTASAPSTMKLGGSTVPVTDVAVAALGAHYTFRFTDVVSAWGLAQVIATASTTDEAAPSRVFLEVIEWGDASSKPTPTRAVAAVDASAGGDTATSSDAPAADDSSSSASPDELPRPLADAQPGEWIRCVTSFRAPRRFATVRIVDADATHVVLATEIQAGDSKLEGQQRRRPREARRAGRAKPTMTRESITVGDRTYDCIVRHAHTSQWSHRSSLDRSERAGQWPRPRDAR